MSFIDASLLDRVAYGFSGGPTWSTTRVKLISGRSKRNAERSLPLHRFTAPFNNIRPEHRDIIVDSYMACLGPVHAFRFKDYSDFELLNVVIGVAAGGAGETMQVIKPYTFGTETLERKITKPNVGLTLTEDDVSLAHTLDPLTGIVTFTSTVGKTIRATGTFDVPVFFDDDNLDFSFETWEALSVDIVLEEDFTA